MTKFNQALLTAAGAYIGLSEWPGAKHNPQVVRLFGEAGHPGVQDDETPWCAAFVGAVLAQVGLPTSGELNARSYSSYGVGVELQRATPGDIVVLWRGSRSGWQGHVAFLVRFEGDQVVLRGGNQGNQVSDARYGVDKILSIRRADGVAPKGSRPVLRSEDKGVWVRDLQDQLSDLGYTLGSKDGVFGSRTLSAVVAFQNDNRIPADGVVGPRTWETLQKATPRAKRKIQLEELQQKSRTLQTADEGKVAAVVTTAVGTAGASVAAAEQAYDVAQRAGGLVEGLVSAGPWVAVVLAVAVGGFLVWRGFRKIQELRVEDAISGANDSK